jgi:hypothetical protein
MDSGTSIVSKSSAFVTLQGSQEEVDVLNLEGDVVETYPSEDNVVMEFNLLYDGGWRVDKLFLVEQQ